MANGHAYVAEGHVYFSVASWPTYGELSKLSPAEMLPLALERGSKPEMPGRRDPLDFVLWQPSLPDEPAWESPWGAGRPGWHIECSAMSSAYLGNHFEIHGGGADLAFPHHESEIAQSEAATGQRPFVEWWMHAGMLHHEAEKMSKSLGNLVLVRDLLRTFSGDAIRLYLVSHHYRAELAYSQADLEAAAVTAARLRTAGLVAGPGSLDDADPASLSPVVRQHRDRFLEAMDNDLDTPSAMPQLMALATLALESPEPAQREEASRAVQELGGSILGLRLAAAAGPAGDGRSRRDVTPPPDDEMVPVSVRLGTVVPPEDPEDWTRPLTWVAAVGMLAPPAVALAWFFVAGPRDSTHPVLGTWIVALALVIGAAAAGGTQLGRLRAFTGTLGAGLLAALLVVVAGAVSAGERQVGSASPTLAHAVAAALAGLAGASPAAALGAFTANSWSRLQRGAAAAALGAVVTVAVLPGLFRA